ncbi:DNase I-like protein [Lepidopterella palustris CBS 459.81]|uniref:DNase I-like protein n=1 Tax=Lepidopterella palustris CBS 459.81 TaxID=1314670 RepID=A0A8E2JDP8_9PEZI|nr:DNase I-like protein [Lepidopterella palustris CBS 459.81]
MASSNPANRSSVDLLDSTIPGAFPHAQISTHQTLSQAVYARRAEYTRPRRIRIKVGSWNVAALKGIEKDVGGWFVDGRDVEEAMAGLALEGQQTCGSDERESVKDQEARRTKETTLPWGDPGTVPGGDEIGIYALGLQEVVDVNSPAEALRPYTDPTTANKYKSAIEEVLPEGYRLVAEQQLIGLLILIYASPMMIPEIKSVSTTSVGTGLMGYMGNKGAVTARLILGETTRLVFINSHLGAGADKTALERRNWDVSQITSRTRFDPIADLMGVSQASGEALGEEDFAFWFGDLNYRLEGIPGDDVRRLLTVHTTDSSSASSFADACSQFSTSTADSEVDSMPIPAHMDPASLHTTLSSLLPHDELHQQQKARKAFHDGWQEGPIEFLPTYKYDIGSVGVFDSSEKKRSPSWCDRILYRTRRDKLAYDAKIKEEEEARKKDEEMKARGLEDAGADEDVLFDYNPETDGDEYDDFADAEDEVVVTKEGFEDEMFLEYYTAHQRVLSSDHKPLSAVFALKYDAVVPDLKAHIYQEVARELDRAENEGRPTITLVVDHSATSLTSTEEHSSNFEGVNFGDVKYATPKRRSVTIANTGRVPATISFVDRPAAPGQPEGPAPPWLSIAFDRPPNPPAATPSDTHSVGAKQYTIDPAEVCNVTLTLLISPIPLVRALNEGLASLDDILVLRVEGGRDHFLPVRGNWLQSALGMSIDRLIRIPEGGVRKLQGQKPSGAQPVKWSAPRELFRLTEAVEDSVERAIAEWDMTAGEGDVPPWLSDAAWPFASPQDVHGAENGSDVANEATEEQVFRLRVYEALDTDTPFEKAFEPNTPTRLKLSILAETLVFFLRSLEDGIVTVEMWQLFENGMAAREKAKQQLSPDDGRAWALEILSSAPNHNVSLILITSMLSRILNEIVSASLSSRVDGIGGSMKGTPRSSLDVTAQSPTKGRARRMTLTKNPEAARRWDYATLFAPAMIRAESLGKGREKETRVRDERAVGLIELFLREEETGK